MGTPPNARNFGRSRRISGIYRDRVYVISLARYPILTRIDRLTVANEMLSLLGSLQDDPFSPEHGRPPANTVLDESEIEDIEVEREIEANTEEEIESDGDTFETLGKMSDELKATREKETKRKPKGERKGNVKRKKMNVDVDVDVDVEDAIR
jgi:hypothetical protein